MGYVANITETSDGENDFQLILKVQVGPNTTDDAKMLAEIVPELKKEYGLELMDADGAYGSPEGDEVMAQEKVKLRQTALRGRKPGKDTLELSSCDLEVDPEDRKLLRVTTPEGAAMQVEPGRKPGRYILHYPQAPEAFTVSRKPVYISQRQLEVALRRQRCASPEPDGKNPRAAVEATIGATKRPFGNDKLPARASMMIGAAAMVNLRRIQRFRTEQRQEAIKKAKEKGIKSFLLSLFNHLSATFLKQFHSVTRFSTRYC